MFVCVCMCVWEGVLHVCVCGGGGCCPHMTISKLLHTYHSHDHALQYNALLIQTGETDLIQRIGTMESTYYHPYQCFC